MTSAANDGAPDDLEPIVVAGAGSIGCFVGALLASAGHRVVLLGRPRILDDITANGLTATDYSGLDVAAPMERVTLETDAAAALREAGLVLVTVKSGATTEMGAMIAAHAPPTAPIVSLQNGVSNRARLAETLADRDLRAGMVPFNVVQLGKGRFHRATSGAVVVEPGPAPVAEKLNVTGLATHADADIEGVLWGKLLLNLNNALNALSGLPLKEELGRRAWRTILADMMEEALRAMSLAGVRPKAALPMPPRLLPFLLRLPDRIYARLSQRMTPIDPEARSSMWEDLEARRLTEIDELQGAVVRLSRTHGRIAPLCARVASLIADAETARAGSPALSPEDIRRL